MSGSPLIEVPMTEDAREQRIKSLRDQVLTDARDMMPGFAELVVAEGTPSAYKLYYDVAMKMVPGLSADSRNKNDHLPMVIVNFGANGGSVTTIDAAPPPPNVEDVQSRPVTAASEAERIARRDALVRAEIERLKALDEAAGRMDPFSALVAAVREDSE